MEMTIQEVKQLDKDSYQIIDIRDDNEIAHGGILVPYLDGIQKDLQDRD